MLITKRPTDKVSTWLMNTLNKCVPNEQQQRVNVGVKVAGSQLPQSSRSVLGQDTEPHIAPDVCMAVSERMVE